jgi:hypothetical protein
MADNLGMSVVVDDETLEAESLGLRTVGQVLDHVRQGNRLVVQLLVDGQAPDLKRMGSVQAQELGDHIVFIETADQREFARQTLQQASEKLEFADEMRLETAELLRSNDWTAAMTKLSGCLVIWQQVRQTVVQVAALFRLNLEELAVSGDQPKDVLATFAEQLRAIKAAIEIGDITNLTDLLTYEIEQTTSQWRSILDGLDAAIR